MLPAGRLPSRPQAPGMRIFTLAPPSALGAPCQRLAVAGALVNGGGAARIAPGKLRDDAAVPNGLPDIRAGHTDNRFLEITAAEPDPNPLAMEEGWSYPRTTVTPSPCAGAVPHGSLALAPLHESGGGWPGAGGCPLGATECVRACGVRPRNLTPDPLPIRGIRSVHARKREESLPRPSAPPSGVCPMGASCSSPLRVFVFSSPLLFWPTAESGHSPAPSLKG